jgi:hypothetical protein
LAHLELPYTTGMLHCKPIAEITVVADTRRQSLIKANHPMSTKTNVVSRLETKTAFIRDLISDIQKGEIKIPQFQRKFVWKEIQALDLLDSISNNYPVGSLLLWRTHTKLAVERNIGDFKLPKTDDHSPTDYVLDGQQRITVIYSCLGAPSEETGFAAGYDLHEEAFIQLEPDPGPNGVASHVLPMRWLFNTTKLLNYRTGLQTLTNAATYQARLDELVEAFSGYRLPVVVLKDLSIEEVCPIFERINSAGTKLSIFDLMVAATWSPTFDLNALSESIAESLEAKGFESIEPNSILKCLSAVHFGGLKRGQMLKLREVKGEEMKTLVATTSAALLRAVDLLSTEFGIFTWDFLPYEAVLVILCHLCSRLSKLGDNHILRIRQWFWRSAFSERYRVGGESFVTADLENVTSFVTSGADPKMFEEALTPTQLAQTTFRSNNSRSRAFILALAVAKPRNITNGALVDTAEALSKFNKKEFHHIFPRGYMKKTQATAEPNVLANICMLAASENNAISDSDPHTYIPEFMFTHGDQSDAVLASNLLPPATKCDYTIVTFQDFVKARSELLAEFVSKLCSGSVHP